MFFKEPLAEWFFVEPEITLWNCLKTFWSTFIFKSACWSVVAV